MIWDSLIGLVYLRLATSSDFTFIDLTFEYLRQLPDVQYKRVHPLTLAELTGL